MIKKIILATIVGAMSFSTFSATKTNWSTQPYKSPDFTLAFEMQSLKVGMEGSYGDETLEANVQVRKIYKTPQKLKSGKFYTHEFYTLYVSCESKEYAQVDYIWNINSKFVAKNDEIALSANWHDFTPVKRAYELSEAEAKQHKFTDIQATLLCQQVLQ